MEMFAAVAGRIVGTSLSPELIIAVIGVVWFASSQRRFLIAFGMAAVAVITIRVFVVSGMRGASPADYPLESILAAVAALLLWSLIGWGLRVAYQRLVPN